MTRTTLAFLADFLQSAQGTDGFFVIAIYEKPKYEELKEVREQSKADIIRHLEVLISNGYSVARGIPLDILIAPSNSTGRLSDPDWWAKALSAGFQFPSYHAMVDLHRRCCNQRPTELTALQYAALHSTVHNAASDSDAHALYGGGSVSFVDKNPRPVEAPALSDDVTAVIPPEYFHESVPISLKAHMHASFGPGWNTCALPSSCWVGVTKTIAGRATLETDIRFWREMNSDTEPEQRTNESLCFKRELSIYCYLNFYGLTRDRGVRRRESIWQSKPVMCLEDCFVDFCTRNNLTIIGACDLVTPFHFADVRIRDARCCITVHSRSSQLSSHAAH